MKYDEFGEVINDEETYKAIGERLKTGKSVLVGWTDGDMTHFDVLFTAGVAMYGTTQGGIKADDLYVSIMRRGAFAFEVVNTDTRAGYYAEKFGGGLGSTADALSELINGVKKNLV